MEISDINTKKIYIEICYFSLINSTFYTKNNLDNNCPYKILEKDIYNMKNEGSMDLCYETLMLEMQPIKLLF